MVISKKLLQSDEYLTPNSSLQETSNLVLYLQTINRIIKAKFVQVVDCLHWNINLLPKTPG